MVTLHLPLTLLATLRTLIDNTLEDVGRRAEDDRLDSEYYKEIVTLSHYVDATAEVWDYLMEAQ